MTTWFAQATHVPALEAEICFPLQDRFYYGPDRPANPADLERLVIPLQPPALQRVQPTMVRTAEAVGHERELIAYYRQIIDLAQKHNRSFNSIRHHFWLRLWLWNTQHKVHISFPWYDSLSEADSFLSALSEEQQGQIFIDADQGWEIEVHAAGDLLYFCQRDPDSDETHLTVAAPRSALISTAQALRERSKAVISHLTLMLGADVWTSYVRNEPTFKKEKKWWHL